MDASAVAEAATLPADVVWTFGRNGSPFRYGELRWTRQR